MASSTTIEAVMVVNGAPDRITSLPDSLLDNILSRVPVRDAVPTCFLSNAWRYRWSTMGGLVFSDPLIQPAIPRSTVMDAMVTFLTRALLLHQGPIATFELTTGLLHSRPEVVEQCILFLTRNGVKEFLLHFTDGQQFRLPSSLFSCDKLNRMELQRCTFDLPLAFRGFSLLKELSLSHFSIATQALETLISSCPLLESLSLSHFGELVPRIHAPNLKFLSLEGSDLREVILDRTLLLDTLKFVMDITATPYMAVHQLEQRPINFLGGVPAIEKLAGRICSTKLLNVADDDHLPALPATLPPLKVMEFHEVGFEDKREIMAALRFIMNFPDLTEIVISASSPPSPAALDAADLNFWEEEFLSGCTFDHLRTAKMIHMSGVPHELAFIKFLLGNSPMLEKLIMVPGAYVVNGNMSMLIQVIEFPRASNRAEIKFIR